MNETAIIGLLAALCGGAIATAITGYFQRPKTRAEARKLENEAGAVLDQRWQDWAAKLEAEVKELRDKVQSLETTLTTEKDANRQTNWLLQLFVEWSLAMRDQLEASHVTPIEPPPGVRMHLARLEEKY